MSVAFKKPENMKYTDMAIYIDANMHLLKNSNEYPQVENKVYEYLYHIIYALACKGNYFKNFSDYDTFASYAAAEVFMSIRNKLINEGKEVRGKVVIPIKSSLNFIKSTIFPLKINYQRETFTLVFDPKIHDGAENIENNIKKSIQSQYQSDLGDSFTLALEQVPNFICKVIQKTPFTNNISFCRNLYISILLTIINDITLPNKVKNKLKLKAEKHYSDDLSNKYISAYSMNASEPMLWHIDNKYSNYVKILTMKVKELFSKELKYYIHSDELSDELLDSILVSSYTHQDDLGDLD